MFHLELYISLRKQEKKAGFGSGFGQLGMCELDTLLMLCQTVNLLVVWTIEISD